MMLTIPHPSEGTPSAGDEIAWRRELKQLRVRVAQLEAERGIKQVPSIEVKRSEEHGYQCGHPCGVVVTENAPRVECEACGTKLDAIEVLREYARHERNFCYSLEHLRKERRDLTKEIEKLKSIRTRLRSLLRKVVPEPPAPGLRKWDRDRIVGDIVDRILCRVPDPAGNSLGTSRPTGTPEQS